MPVLKIEKMGSQHAILLSQEAMTLLAVKEGDHLYLSDTPDGEPPGNACRCSDSRPSQIRR